MVASLRHRAGLLRRCLLHLLRSGLLHLHLLLSLLLLFLLLFLLFLLFSLLLLFLLLFLLLLLLSLLLLFLLLFLLLSLLLLLLSLLLLHLLLSRLHFLLILLFRGSIGGLVVVVRKFLLLFSHFGGRGNIHLFILLRKRLTLYSSLRSVPIHNDVTTNTNGRKEASRFSTPAAVPRSRLSLSFLSFILLAMISLISAVFRSIIEE